MSISPCVIYRIVPTQRGCQYVFWELSYIIPQFKPPELDILTQKLGIEPGMIELLREAGIDTEDELRDRLGLDEDAADTSESSSQSAGNRSEAGSETDQAGGSARGSDSKTDEGNSDAGFHGTSRRRKGWSIHFIHCRPFRRRRGRSR